MDLSTTKQEFKEFLLVLIEKFKIEDVENFVKDFTEIVNNLTLKGFNDLDEINEKYIAVITKYSRSGEDIAKEVLKERELWEK